MPLYDYNVNRDCFEASEDRGLSFPCYACVHRDGAANDAPCNVCDHNLGAEPESAEAVRE